MLKVFYVNDVMVLFARNATSYDVLKLSYYNPRMCKSVEVKQFKSCYNGAFPSQIDLTEIEEKTFEKNFINNCEFKGCYKIAAPFVNENCEDGLELRLVEMIKDKMGFSLKKSCGNMDRGVILQNDTWTGLLEMVHNGSCDFIIGGFYPDNEIGQYFWSSDPYLRDTYTWYINKAKLQPAWKGLITIYTSTAWYLFGFTLMITWITWFTFATLIQEEKQRHASISLTALNNLGVTLGVSVNERPTSTPLKLFFIVLTLFGLTVTGIYTSNLIAVYTSPKYDNQIISIKEVLERGIPFGGSEENKDWFMDDDDLENQIIYKSYNDTEQFIPNSVNFEYVAEGKRVILANRMFAIQSSVSHKIYGFHDHVFSSSIEMVMKRGFPAMKQFNMIIKILKDNGILIKLYNDFLFNNTILKNIKAQHQKKETMITLRVEHLGGAFAIILIGSGFSVIVFILEIILHKFTIPLFMNKSTKQMEQLIWDDFKIKSQQKNQFQSDKIHVKHRSTLIVKKSK